MKITTSLFVVVINVKPIYPCIGVSSLSPEIFKQSLGVSEKKLLFFFLEEILIKGGKLSRREKLQKHPNRVERLCIR